MLKSTWEKIEFLFNSACGLPASERRAFLNDYCAGDCELRDEVEDLLECDAILHNFLDDPAPNLGLKVLSDFSGFIVPASRN